MGRSVNYGNAATDSFVGNGGATYTLTYETPTAAAVVTLDGVVQKNGTDFNITGTSLVFTSVVSSPIVIQVVYLGLSLSLGTPADGTVDASKLATDAVTNVKMANNSVDSAELVAGSVDLAHLSATGTPTASLALKGDFSWGTAGGTSLAGGMIRTNLLAISSPATFAGTENGVTYGPVSVTALVTVTSPSVWHIL